MLRVGVYVQNYIRKVRHKWALRLNTVIYLIYCVQLQHYAGDNQNCTTIIQSWCAIGLYFLLTTQTCGHYHLVN